MANESPIIEKIDRFVRKYYKNRLIRGVIYSAAALLSLFIIVAVLENFGYFSAGIRTLLFWLYIIVLLALVGLYIVNPLLKMRGLGKRISNEEAARIIGRHFPEVKDKLLNLLELQEQTSSLAARSRADSGFHGISDSGNGKGDTSGEISSSLLQAAIDQKTEQLKPVPFVNAVDLKGNRKYVKYAAMPAALIVLILIIAPSFLTEPSRRIINHSAYYEKPAPFTFLVENDALQAVCHDDFLLRVSVKGEALPNEAYIVFGNKRYKLQKQDNGHYSHLFKNLRDDVVFHLSAADVESHEYTLQVLPAPTVLDFRVVLTYPAYTGRKNEVLNNIGDLTVPEGTLVEWDFQTQSVDELHFLEETAPPLAYTPSEGLKNALRREVGNPSPTLVHYKEQTLMPDKNGRLSHSCRVLRSMNYGFFVSNKQVPSSDTLSYAISTIVDAVPMMVAMEMRDSLVPDRVYFKGRIKDDYGFSKLVFKLMITNAKDTTVKRKQEQQLPLQAGVSQEFYYSTNMTELDLQPGDRVSYYFQVWDNDAIHGPKSVVSQTFELKIPTAEELAEQLNDNRAQIEAKAYHSISDLKKLQNEINEMMQRLVDKKELNWQDKQQLQQLAEKQKEVRERLEKMQEQIKENNRLEERYREQNEELMEKQQQLDELMDKVLTDEMKEMITEMDKLMEQIDKNKVEEQLEQMRVRNEDLQKQLNQNIELMKRLELEKQVDEAVQKAEELSQRQKELAEETRKAEKDKAHGDEKAKQQQQLQQQQQELSKEFKRLKQDIKEIQDGYKKLDSPENFDISKQLQQSIEQQQQEAQNQLQKGKNSKAGERQQQAGEELQLLSEQMQQAQQQIEERNTAEDSEQIRRLLKNLVQLSFNQEDLMNNVKSVYIQDPKYQQIIVDQNKVKTDFRNVSDTLLAIAKRQISVANAINKELGTANGNITKSLSDLLVFNQTFYGQSRNHQAATSMQYTMTSLNNLSLILAESLDKMQSQMRQQKQQNSSKCSRPTGRKKSQGQCSNPGGAKPSPKSMKELQDALNKQMESLRKQLDRQGEKTARTQIGKGNKVSEEFARMAAQQEQIRRMMQEYGKEMKENYPGNSKLAKEIGQMVRQMEQTETDLVNRTISSQTMKRQQQIMTRLLEHEKADLQQQKEERRKSREAVDKYQPSQGDLERFEKEQNKNLELFRNTPPTLSPYYKKKVNDYFYKSKI